MPRLPHPLSLLTLLIAASAAAQNVLVVASGGGGAFFDIPPAIAAAAPGDILEVRAGTYSPFLLNKPLFVLADPGTTILQQQVGVRVQGIATGEVAVVRGLTLQSTLPNSLTIEDCAGVVVVESVRAGGTRITMAGQVALRDVACGATTVTDAGLTIVGGSTSGGLVCERSRVTISGTRCFGPLSLSAVLPGLDVRSGRVVATGDAATRIEAGLTFGGSGPAVSVQPGAVFVVDPAVRLVPRNGGPPIAGNAQIVPMVGLTATPTGATLTARTYAAGGTQAFLLLGLVRQPALALPLPFQDLWLADAQIVVDAGPLDANGVRAATVTLPPLPPGLPLAVQSLVLRGGAELSNATAVSF